MKARRIMFSMSPTIEQILRSLMAEDIQENMCEEIRSIIVKEYNARKKGLSSTQSTRPVGRPRKAEQPEYTAEETEAWMNEPATIPDPLNPGKFINEWEIERRKVLETLKH